MSFTQRIKSMLKPARPSRFDAPLQPDETFFAIGDIHGSDQLLSGLLDQISDKAGGEPVTVICVGDYVDRGEDSASVLRRLCDLSKTTTGKFICLRGNHEEMLLAFLDDPERAAGVWLRNGGLQTLASLHVDHVKENMFGQRLLDVREQLAEALGPELISWLRTLPSSWSTGNVTVVHAGADPKRSLEDQRRNVLTWGHPDFLTIPRQDGQWIVYGHTIVSDVVASDGRIGIDTGAYATGRLTAAEISRDGIQTLVSTRKPDLQ